MSDKTHYGTFWEHVEDLRTVIVRSLIIISCGVLLCFTFCDKLIAFLEKPFYQMANQAQKTSPLATTTLEFKKIQNTSSEVLTYFPNKNERVVTLSENASREAFNTINIPPHGFITLENEKAQVFLSILSPIEGMVIAFKVSFWAGIILTAPFWCWGILNFISPAMSAQGSFFTLLFFVLSFICLVVGGALAYYFTIPLANSYLWSFNTSIGQNSWVLKPYLEYTLLLLAANGIAFEGFLILLFLVHFRIVSPHTLASKRRHFIVLAFILGALLTPPDVLTQFLLAIPLIILYECAIFYGYMRKRASLIFSKNTSANEIYTSP